MKFPFPEMTERLLPKYLDTPPYPKPFKYVSKDPNYVPMTTYQEKWEPSKEWKKYYADLDKEKKKDKEEIPEQDVWAYSLLFK
ncbi:hypothetical protein M9Y10_025508 [Tritrichomonas musculus]|uniref:Uncharacterized protein n=1 Tax=Tritrichomonas musculus TaxID=1915356 RepID=A0ABR2H8U9_9EUKA